MTEETKAARSRASNVRTTILSLLAHGPLSMEDMSFRGKFSPQSGFLNAKKLKEEGLISTAREGRSVRYVLAESAPETAVPLKKGAKVKKVPVKKGRPAGTTVASGGESLKDALKTLVGHLAPITNLKEKIAVIDQLVSAVPQPVAKVLSSIKNDLIARSGGVSGGG